MFGDIGKCAIYRVRQVDSTIRGVDTRQGLQSVIGIWQGLLPPAAIFARNVALIKLNTLFNVFISSEAFFLRRKTVRRVFNSYACRCFTLVASDGDAVSNEAKYSSNRRWTKM